MFIPIRTDYQMTGKPWVNYALVAANVLIFAAGYRGDSQAGLARIDHWLLHPDSPYVWQFLSSAFLHGGWGHVLGNMVFLWVFGNAVNDRLGHAGYLAFYLGGGVLAGIAYILLGGHAPVLGASGAISAVTGAYLVLLPRARVTLLMWFVLITTFEVSSLYFLMFQLVFNLYMSLRPAFGGVASGGVAYAAHCGGYAFGIVVTACLLAVRLLPRDPLDLLNLIRAGHRRAKYRRMVRAGYDPFNYVSPAIRDQRKKWVDAKAVAEAPDSPAARELQLRRAVADAWSAHDLPTTAAKYLELIQIADDAVLPQPQQLDVGNQLMAQEQYPAAADAYERLLKHYPNCEHLGDIYLMLGLLYGRYLHQRSRAEQLLTKAVEMLHDERKLELARSDLQALRHHR